MKKTKVKFFTSTLKFSIVGIFIPGLTIFFPLGLQILLTSLNVECSRAWVFIWTLTGLGTVGAPIIFSLLLTRRMRNGVVINSSNITFFNVIEYTFIQSILASYFTTGKTLCYVTDGQNGIEFIFTGWMAIPLLILMSVYFDYQYRKLIVKYSE